MGAVATLPAAKPGLYRTTTFRAFRIDGDRVGEIALNNPAILEQAVSEAKIACLHREHLAIRETRGANTKVHLYVIKRRSQPTWEWRGPEKVRVHDLYAEAVTMLPGAVFA